MKKSDPKSVAATAPGKFYVALNLLYLSPGNVRKTEPSQIRIEQLGATILSQGLLHALHITAELDTEGKPTGRYAVEAGGRRLRALQWLAANGKIFIDFPIECVLIEPNEASKVSLVENMTIESMHPADEFAAYQTLVTEGKTLESIADGFGVTVVHVQRRLKMANVAPELLDLYRKGEVTLDQIMALASVDDQERQLSVWHSLPSYSRHAHTIKNRLCEHEVIATDVRAKVVGLENYLAAGGSIRADLFSEDGAQYFTDMGLLEMLLGERLEAEAVIAREEGWSWVDVLPSYGFQEQQSYRSQPATYLDETPEITTERNTIEAEIEKLAADNETAQEADDWELSEKLDEQTTALEARLEALQESRLDTGEVDKSVSGAVVSLNHSGLVVLRGLIRRDDCKEAKAGGNGTPAKSTRAEVPEKLMMDLSSQRTAAIQALMISNQKVTLAALAYKLAASIFKGYDNHSPLKISLTQNRSSLEKNSLSLAQSRAALALDAEHAAWMQKLPKDSANWFSWLLEQPQETVLTLIVFATAHCADALQHTLGGTDNAGPMARALNLDMADWWEASPTAYLELVPKAKLMEAVTETAGAQAADAMLKMKKQEACVYAASHIQGKRWLPLALRSTHCANDPVVAQA